MLYVLNSTKVQVLFFCIWIWLNSLPLMFIADNLLWWMLLCNCLHIQRVNSDLRKFLRWNRNTDEVGCYKHRHVGNKNLLYDLFWKFFIRNFISTYVRIKSSEIKSSRSDFFLVKTYQTLESCVTLVLWTFLYSLLCLKG